MPIYEYRCRQCGAIGSHLAAARDAPRQMPCESCNGVAARILSRPSVHLSARSKSGRLDPKYDKMVDVAMRNSSGADPDRLINRRGDIAKGRADD